MSLLDKDPRSDEVMKAKMEAFGTIAVTVTDPESKVQSLIELNPEEYLRYRYVGSKPLAEYEEGADPFAGMLVRVLMTDFVMAGLKKSFTALFGRLHPALFNPETAPNLQVRLINRSLRAMMGAMAFDTMPQRVTLTDDITELGDWVTIYKMHILPCFLNHEFPPEPKQSPQPEIAPSEAGGEVTASSETPVSSEEVSDQAKTS